MAGDEVFTITLELESLTVVLTNQIAQPRFGETNARTYLRGEGPFEFLGGGIDSVTWRRWRSVCSSPWGFVRFRIRRKFGLEHGGCSRVDRACKEHEPFGKDIGREPEYGVTINARVLEVDAGGAVGANNELQLCKFMFMFCLTDDSEIITLSYHRFVQVPTWTPLVKL